MLLITADWPRHCCALGEPSLCANRNCPDYLAAPAWPDLPELAAIRRLERYPLFISISLTRYRNERARLLHKITRQELKSSTGISRNNLPTKRRS